MGLLQINVKPRFKEGEKERTIRLLQSIRKRGNIKEYLRYKWYLKVANFADLMDIGFVDYNEALCTAERNFTNFKDVLRDYSYSLESKNLDNLSENDLNFLKGKHLFCAPTLSLIQADTKGIQKAYNALIAKKIEFGDWRNYCRQLYQRNVNP